MNNKNNRSAGEGWQGRSNKQAENLYETERKRRVRFHKVNCGYANASLPHIGEMKMRELRLMGLVCVCERWGKGC